MSQHSQGPTKVYVSASARLSRAMGRVAAALTAYANSNGLDVARYEEDADIIVLHVVGYPDTVAAIEAIKAQGKKYALIQYCVRSTQKPSTLDWVGLWTDDSCVGVWSYYDLVAMLTEELENTPGSDYLISQLAARFYFAPMGAASNFTKSAPSGRSRPYRLMTSGYVADSECIEECAAAVTALDARMFHLGPGFMFFGPNVNQEEGVNDAYLVDLYNRSEYVAGLRRCEGFEMPALEGLLCGARPVCFDRPHYRHWFGDHAEYIPEGTPSEVTAALQDLLACPARPVTDDERTEVLAKFNWRDLANGFWRTVAPDAIASLSERRLRLLWVGDAVISSGFARATHRIIPALTEHYDVAVLGINYNGDPHPYPYKIYPALNHMALSRDMDMFGTTRVAEVARMHNADMIVIQQDPWNFPAYVRALRKAEVLSPVIGFVAVDGKNCNGNALNCLDHAIFWTAFGEKEARLGGYTGTSSVVPLGVDPSIYFPMPKAAARQLLELPSSTRGAFIVGNVCRNQPRKRLDLTVQYFAKWAREYGRDDAYLFLHVAPTGDIGWDVEQLMRYYHSTRHLILSQPDPGLGIPESTMCWTYNAFDVQVSTTAGEGWGLPTLEGMACGVPQIVPDWAALGEWPGDGVVKIDCPTQTHSQNNINVVGGVPDEADFVRELERLYRDRAHRQTMAERALGRASSPMFDWGKISTQFADEIKAFVVRISQPVETETVNN